MSETDPRVEAFFDTAPRWREELAAVRRVLRACPLTETYKWRGPCYTAGGANVATLWGLKDACTLGFFKGVLLKDQEGILEAPGENSRSARTVKFRSLVEVEALEGVLKRYVHEAIENEKAGLKVEFRKDDLAWPEELTERLAADPDLKAAFEALTPGRRRGYLLHFAEPKQSATRAARIEKSAPRILAGKGRHDR